MNRCGEGGDSTNYCDVFEDIAMCYTVKPCYRDGQNCVPHIPTVCSEHVVFLAVGGKFDACTWGS